jgi:hypothetical protein
VRTADGLTTVATYAAPLQTLGLQGAALTVLASGFLVPANNSSGPAFGLWVALPSGGPLVELPVATSIAESENELTSVSVWPVPASDAVTVRANALREVITRMELVDATGRIAREFGQRNIPQGTTQIAVNVEGINPGSYVLRMMTETGTTSVPMLVAR